MSREPAGARSSGWRGAGGEAGIGGRAGKSVFYLRGRGAPGAESYGDDRSAAPPPRRPAAATGLRALTDARIWASAFP